MKSVTINKTGKYYLQVTDSAIEIRAGVLATITIVPPVPYTVNRQQTLTLLPSNSIVLQLNVRNWEIGSGNTQANTIPALIAGKILSNDGKVLKWIVAVDVNIYNADGTLTADRTVTQAGFDLSFVDGNFTIFGKGSSSDQIGLSYIDAQTDAIISVGYDSGSGYATTQMSSVDVVTGNEGAVSASFDSATLKFLDTSVDANRYILLQANSSGIEVDGNANDATLCMDWHGWDGANNVLLANIKNNGEWEWNLYPNTRDDSAELPINFLYTDASGNLLSAPLDYAKPYKVYTALLNQTGTSAPTATVLENTLGGAISWAYAGTGLYTGTPTVPFVDGKTWIIVGKTSDGLINGFAAQGRAEGGDVIVDTGDMVSQTAANDQLVNTPIEIRVYP